MRAIISEAGHSRVWQRGDIVKINLVNGTFGYGRVLPDPLMAFYDI
ncbi:MAG: hypothetical protein LBT81_00200 [Helicobacteraceae bacterium]|nr:hypothetical protein [Helicobacteraceae bacterium]